MQSYLETETCIQMYRATGSYSQRYGRKDKLITATQAHIKTCIDIGTNIHPDTHTPTNGVTYWHTHDMHTL